MKVNIIHTLEVSYGLSIVPKSVTLNYLERRSGRYSALFHQIRQLWRAIMSKCWNHTHTLCDSVAVQLI